MPEKLFVAIDDDEVYYITEAWQLIYEACMIGGDNVNWLNKLYDENKELKDKLFEAEKTLLIETADISDYAFDNVEKDIEELRKEIYGEGDLND